MGKLCTRVFPQWRSAGTGLTRVCVYSGVTRDPWEDTYHRAARRIKKVVPEKLRSLLANLFIVFPNWTWTAQRKCYLDGALRTSRYRLPSGSVSCLWKMTVIHYVVYLTSGDTPDRISLVYVTQSPKRNAQFTSHSKNRRLECSRFGLFRDCQFWVPMNKALLCRGFAEIRKANLLITRERQTRKSKSRPEWPSCYPLFSYCIPSASMLSEPETSPAPF